MSKKYNLLHRLVNLKGKLQDKTVEVEASVDEPQKKEPKLPTWVCRRSIGKEEFNRVFNLLISNPKQVCTIYCEDNINKFKKLGFRVRALKSGYQVSAPVKEKGNQNEIYNNYNINDNNQLCI